MVNQLDKQSRAILPIPDQVQHGLTTYDAKDPDTHFPPICQIETPEGGPNVVLILLDDVRRPEVNLLGEQPVHPTDH